VLDAQTNKTYTFFSKIVFCECQRVEQPWVLMNSATDVWPVGWQQQWELVTISWTITKPGCCGEMEGYEDKYVYGRRPNALIVRLPIFRVPNATICGLWLPGGCEPGRVARSVAEMSTVRV